MPRLARLIAALLAAPLAVWLVVITPDVLRAYAPMSALRVALLGKPLATVRFDGVWNLALAKGGENYAPWVDRFDTTRTDANLQTLFDDAESLVVVHPSRTAPFQNDDLTRALRINDVLQNLQIGTNALLIQDVTWTQTGWRWPFLRVRNRRFVVVLADEELGKYDSACHAELLTAWATPKSEGYKGIMERCALSRQ